MLGGTARLSSKIRGHPGGVRDVFYIARGSYTEVYNDGLDLNAEEDTLLNAIIRLIDRLEPDLGSSSIITLTPVTAALQRRNHLSGLDYEALEFSRGEVVKCYYTQLYSW